MSPKLPQFLSESTECLSKIGSEVDQSLSMRFLVCSDSERIRLYKLSKQGFTMQQRRECWMIATGARQAMVSAPEQYYSQLVAHCVAL